MGLLDALGTAADLISTPGQLVRGLLAGRPGDMLSGHDLLSEYGLDPGDGVGGTLAGVGTDIATDPLTYAGGALARALLGGKFRPLQTSVSGGRLGAERDIFDLAPNWEANAGRLEPRVVHYPEVVPEPPAPAEAIAATPRPGLPMPDAMGFMTHYGSDTNWAPGIADDALAESGPLAGFRTSLGTWDRALDDLHVMGPDAYGQLTGGASGVPSEAGLQWQNLLHQRWADLHALRSHPEIVQGWDELAGPVAAQADRIRSLRAANHPFEATGSSAGFRLDQIRHGVHSPSRVTDFLDPASTVNDLAHLPIDPAALKRLAAARQEEELLRRIGDRANMITDFGEIPLQDLRETYAEDYLRTHLRGVFDRGWLAEQGFEPNIIDRVLAATPETAMGRSNLAMEAGDAERIAYLRQLQATLEAEHQARLAQLPVHHVWGPEGPPPGAYLD